MPEKGQTDMTKTFRLSVLLLSSTIALSACQSTQNGGADWVSGAGRILQSGLEAYSNHNGGGAILGQSEIAAGLKEALRLGATQVVSRLGQANGFNLDPKIHIPLPAQLQQVDKALSAIGLGSLTQSLEHRLNKAAELATPKAKQLFINAVSNLSIQDAYSILKGSQDAATTYLRKATGGQLTDEMLPLIQSALAQAGAVQLYDQVIGEYSSLPFMPDVKANLNNYVAEKALDGIFYYVAQEELKIRTNPAARTTELLKKVFAAQ